MIRKLNLAILAGVGSLFISLVGMAFIAVSNPDYLSLPGKNQYPDAIDYLALGDGIASKGQFSRTPDGQPDILRTPFYPLILAVCGAHRHPLILYLVQIAMLAVTVALIVQSALDWLGNPSAVLVMVLLWMEYRLPIMCFQAMSEIASLFFMTCGLWMLGWPALLTMPRLTFANSVAAGALLGISVMVRPAILYFPLILAGAAVAYHLFHSNRWSRSVWVPLLSFTIVYLAMPTIWTVRNWMLFGIPTLTPIGSHNLVYFAGAGAWQFKYGIERFDAQEELVKQFNIPPYTIAQNPYNQSQLTVREIEEAIQSEQLRILFSHPLSLVASSSIGVVKASLDHSLDSLGHLLNMTWKNVGMGGLIRMQSTALQKLLENDWRFLGILFLYTLHVISLWTAVAVGVFRVIRIWKPRIEFFGFALLLAYGYLIVALFGMDASFRSTIVALPALYLLAGYAMHKSNRSNENPLRGSIV